MALEVKKAAPVLLREVGLDERWLQDRIKDDPSLLGLGDLEIVSREHRQPIGGRIDFLMRNSEFYYEVEIMLGAIAESHIIRSIEYWDIERQRRPQHDHVAVIVAEKITSRFFNVLRLLNRAVPMIAVQMSAFRFGDGEIVLHPVAVLNVAEETSDDTDVDPWERVDRAYWEKRSALGLLRAVDTVSRIVNEPRLTWNRGHVAMGTGGYNFCWFHPRRGDNCHLAVRLKSDQRDQAVASLQAVGIDATPNQTDYVTFSISVGDIDKHSQELKQLLAQAEEWSRR
jgi:hypothetical protein